MTLSEKIIVVLRWIAVLPFAILCMRILPFIFDAISSFSNFSDNGADAWWLKYIAPVIGNLLTSYFCIKGSAFIAPFHKKNAALAVFALLLMGSGYVVIVNYLEGVSYSEVAQAAGNVIGSTTAFLEVEKQYYKIMYSNK